jgi:hypothetical protein
MLGALGEHLGTNRKILQRLRGSLASALPIRLRDAHSIAKRKHLAGEGIAAEQFFVTVTGKRPKL